MEKLINKLYKLVEQRITTFSNGKDIKRIVTNDDVLKPFQVHKVKYMLVLEVESKCDHTTKFIPTEPIVTLISYENKNSGRIYTGYENIANFLKISVKDVIEIYKLLVVDSLYTVDEINQCKKDYDRFLVSFKEDFCL